MYTVLYLYWWGGHCCPTHCDLFKIYCAPPNLGITRTWIGRLKFAQRLIFSVLRFFNEPEVSDSGPLSLKSLSKNLCTGILRPEKIHRPQPDLNPQTLDLGTSTLPRDHRGRLGDLYSWYSSSLQLILHPPFLPVSHACFTSLWEDTTSLEPSWARAPQGEANNKHVFPPAGISLRDWHGVRDVGQILLETTWQLA